MKRLRIIGIALICLAVGLILAQQWLTIAQLTTGIYLDPVSGSVVKGTATITAATNPEAIATVVIDVAGLKPGGSYPVYLHAGTCAQPSASFGVLGALAADSNGRARMTVSSVRISAGGATKNLTLPLLADGDHIIAIQGDNIVACGSIPQVAAASITQNTAGSPLPLIAGILGVLGLLTVAVSFVL